MYILRGIVSLTLLGVNTLIACVPLYLLGLVRAPCRGGARRWLSRQMDRIIDAWVGGNRLMFRALGLTRIDAQWEGAEDLAPDGWYLVVSNHRSWADILVLQNTLLGHIPPLKFFTKRQLIWIPLLGVAMWLLGFPYVRRASRATIERDPGLLRRDRDATLAACERFRDHPASVLNFVEGTRFTPLKHAAQQARFDNLLNPKLGGVSYVVTALKDQIDKLVDVTITYPHGTPTFWTLMQGRCPSVRVLVQARPIPDEIRTAPDSQEVRSRLRPWIDAIWQEKDQRLTLERLAN